MNGYQFLEQLREKNHCSMSERGRKWESMRGRERTKEQLVYNKMGCVPNHRK